MALPFSPHSHSIVRNGAVLLLTAFVAACAQESLTEGSAQISTTGSFTSALDRDSVSTDDVKRLTVIKNPTLADIMKPGPLPDRSLGNPNAKVTVIEYGSWTCPYCRAFREKTWPQFKRAYIDTGKVRYILREFPIGRSSGNAALVTRCAPAKDFFKLYALYLRNQASWVSQEVRPDKIYAIAAKTGMSRKTFNACLENEKLIAGVKAIKDRGRELGVIGTPTFFFNNKQRRSFLSFEQVKAEIDPLLAGGRVAASSATGG